MKNKDYLKQLKKEAEFDVPDPYSKIISAAEAENLLQPANKPVDADLDAGRGNTAVLMSGKRRLIAIMAIAAAAMIVCLAVLLPVMLKNRNNITIIPSPVQLSTDDVYGIGAVSTAKLLEYNSPDSKKAAKNVINEPLSDNRAIAQISTFNKYYVALDSFFGDDVVKTNTIENTNPSYPYDKQMNITGMNSDGAQIIYTMYFTEKLSDSEIDDNKTKNEYLLTGKMIIDGKEYYIEGERSFEQDGEETENELKIRAYNNLNDRKNYIEMEQENSVENDETETEYVYSIYSDGKLIEQTAIELETERKNGKEQTDYELEFRKGNAKGKYKIMREVKHGKTSVKVKYDIDGEKGEFSVREVKENGKNKNEFTFGDGTVIGINK